MSSGFYYLQSRFYDPTIGRFINRRMLCGYWADAMWVLGVEQGSLLQWNLFTYCLNNPVNGIDEDGHFKHLLAGTLVGGLVGGIFQVAANINNGERLTYGLGSAVVAGGYAGFLITSGAGVGAVITHGALVGFACSGARMVYNGIVHGREPDFRALRIDTIVGALPTPGWLGRALRLGERIVFGESLGRLAEEFAENRLTRGNASTAPNQPQTNARAPLASPPIPPQAWDHSAFMDAFR